MTPRSHCERGQDVKPHRSSNDTATNDGPEVFVLTKEYRRFAEFCDACRHYRYIGLCYGAPGVGKTLSARHYANWDQVETYRLYTGAAAEAFAGVVGSTTVFYTPPVVNSPGRIEQEIAHRRTRLQALA